MQQIRNALAFVAACDGVREPVAMAWWLTRFAVGRSILPKRPMETTLSLHGLRLSLDWGASEHVPLREVVIRGEYWPEEGFRPSAGQTVVDVGANAGVYAVYAASRVGPGGHVIAIEPNPAVVARLERNLRDNGLDAICTVVPVAISRQARSGSLVVGVNTTIGSLAERDVVGVEVPVATLDEIVCGAGLRDVDLLKVDVEGSEVDVLEGAAQTLRRCRRVVVEVSESTSKPVSEGLVQGGFGRVFGVAAGRDSGGGLVFAERDLH